MLYETGIDQIARSVIRHFVPLTNQYSDVPREGQEV